MNQLIPARAARGMSRFINLLARFRSRDVLFEVARAPRSLPSLSRLNYYFLLDTAPSTFICSFWSPTRHSQKPKAPCEEAAPCHRPRTPTPRHTQSDRRV